MTMYAVKNMTVKGKKFKAGEKVEGVCPQEEKALKDKGFLSDKKPSK